MMLAARFDLTFVATGETVTDVEALCRGVMGAERWPVFLEARDNDELLAFLLGESVVLERAYRPRDAFEHPGRWRNANGNAASSWLFQRLRWKARDWRDAQLRHRTMPELPELDPEHGDASSGLGRAGRQTDRSGLGAGSVGDASGPPPGDRGDSWVDALRGLLEGGDRALLREIEALGLCAPPGARGRTPAARRALRRLDRVRLARVAASELDREAVAA